MSQLTSISHYSKKLLVSNVVLTNDTTLYPRQACNSMICTLCK